MRHHLAVTAVLGTTLFLATACSDKAATSEAGAPEPASGGASAAAGASAAPVDPKVAASADAALSGNTKAICAQAARAGTSFGEIFIADLKLQIDAASKDAAAKSQAKQKIDRDVQNYSYALADMAKLTKDAPLKKALTSMSKQVKALKGDVKKLDADKMSELTATLDKACGKS